MRQAKEFALDVHLLMRAAYFSIDENFSPELLDDAAPQHRAAMAPVMVERLCEAMAITGDGMETIGKVLQLDPILVDDYVRYTVQVHDDSHGSIEFGDCAGIDDDVCRSPLDWLDGFLHMAQAVNPRCRAARTGERSWDLHIDSAAEPVEPHWLASGIGGGGLREFDLRERRVELSVKSS